MDEQKPFAITGATGTLGRAFARVATDQGIPFTLLSRREMNLMDPVSIDACLDCGSYRAVINTAGYVRVDDAQDDLATCHAVNCTGAVLLARACATRDLPLVSFSSDLVFDGGKETAYTEEDSPCPLNEYGKSKAEAERRMLAEHPSALVIRTSAFFGPWDVYNFAVATQRALDSGEPFLALDDSIVSPTYVPSLVRKVFELVQGRESGIRHVANVGEVSWVEFARMIARASELDESLIKPVRQEELHLRAARPRYAVLGSCYSTMLEPLEEAIATFLEQRGRENSLPV